jgi:putative hydrolase of the HAD superfamily
MTKTIIFDFGNVIGFFDYQRTTDRLARHSPLSSDAIRQLIYGGELEDAYERGRLSSAGFLRTVRDRCQVACSDEELIQAYVEMFWPNEEVCRIVPALRGRYRLLLGSNTTELHSRHFRKQFAGTLQHFDALVLSHEIGARKPGAEFFQHCRRLAGCAAEECLFIDDVAANVAGARACGLQGLVYERGSDLRRPLGELGIDVER